MELLHALPLADTLTASPLIKAYLQQDARLQSLVTFFPSPETFRQQIDYRRTLPCDRTLLADTLSRQYDRLPKKEATDFAISALRLPNCFTITAAHQNALLHGPLYNLIKCLQIIRLSRELKTLYPEFAFVPLFWLGSEDHDIDELNHISIQGKTYRWQTEHSGAVGRFSPAGLQSVYAELHQDGQLSDSLFSFLSESLERSADFATHTADLLHHWLGEEGLLVLNADDRACKAAFRPVMEKELFTSAAKQQMRETLQHLQQHFTVQANPRDINLFYLLPEGRHRIERNGESFSLSGTNRTFSPVEIKKELQEFPERFSPNVILRPLYQEFLLPNLAFVGGAGELSYWLELKAAAEQQHIAFPILCPRSSVTLLSPSQQRKWDKVPAHPADWFCQRDELIRRVMTKLSTFSGFQTEKTALQNIFADIINKAGAIDTTLKGAAAAEEKKALQSVEHIEQKIRKAEKQKQQTLLSQVETLHEQLLPGGHFQERSLSTLEYLNQCEKKGLSFWLENTETLKPQHYILGV